MMGRMDKQRKLPKPLKGFSNITRYFDVKENIITAKILPGEFYVTNQVEQIVTVLGSCVSACIRDKVSGVGGMNHFMLPANAKDERIRPADMSAAARYGTFAMELLINEILKNGGNRSYLEVKIFGGGKILHALTDIGAKNIEFVRDYISTEELELVAEDVGDVFPRKVIYQPKTGKVRLKRLRAVTDDIALEEKYYQESLKNNPMDGGVDLF